MPLPDGKPGAYRLLIWYNLTMKKQIGLIKKALVPVADARQGRPDSSLRCMKSIFWSVHAATHP